MQVFMCSLPIELPQLELEHAFLQKCPAADEFFDEYSKVLISIQLYQKQYLRIYVLLVALEWAFGDDSDAITEIPKKALYIHV